MLSPELDLSSIDGGNDFKLSSSAVGYHYIRNFSFAGCMTTGWISHGFFLSDEEAEVLVQKNLIDQENLIGVRTNSKPRMYGKTYLSKDLKNLKKTQRELKLIDESEYRIVAAVLDNAGFHLNEERVDTK